ncbi:Nucleolar/coiled-body phosphoprotein [Quillaja saponaria]|uniref:Nucleolar/coiled-body phosphoprotein n=1 Tax=Quillaja saponaria TaxID=32244 RepID=A0AAD7QBC0_QUISA|nr:Nucleolar/coiled-body phosphoprotein [Quillaja saponaria]
MASNLFEGLPPPSANPIAQSSPSHSEHQEAEIIVTNKTESPPVPALKPILKSALKRSKPAESDIEAAAPKKSLRFKTTTDASETQVIEAMRKISSHIKNPEKFSKASKLAIQLIQAGSILQCEQIIICCSLQHRTATEQLNKTQQNQLTVWTIQAVVANDLFTDDSFVFSKAASRIKEHISNLPVATEDDDIEEAVSLKDNRDSSGCQIEHNMTAEDNEKEEADPFGLDALIPGSVKKGDKAKGKKDTATKIRKEESKRFLRSKREALITCLEIAAQRYRTPWCQTVIDILVKHAFDNVAKFTTRQRDAIQKLWASVREQQAYRKQGKSVSGKLDVNGFEWLQQKYANEKISIRHSVGGSGDRRAQQWLG